MSRSRKMLAALSLAALCAAAVVGGLYVTRGSAGASDASASEATSSSTPSAAGSAGTSTAADVPTTTSAHPTSPEDDGDGTDPESGQTLATDPPVVATAAAVPVKVTFYGWQADERQVLVGGYVAGIVEDGGTCTLTLTQGGTTVTEQVQATADASSTACGAITVSGDRLAGGTWQAVLSYASGSHAGAAPAVPVEVAL